MRSQIKNVVSLFLICFIAAGLLAAVNMLTSPVIADKLAQQANAALIEVLPDGEGFAEIDLNGKGLPASVTKAYSTSNGAGNVIQVTTSGYGNGLVIMFGVSADGKITGSKCISSSETLGYEKTYGANLVGATTATLDSIDTVAGATMTTGAYREAAKTALNAAVVLAGGSADFRTEEEIFQDNLAAALPAGEGKFSYHFVPETLIGVDKVYAADNGEGYVLIMGESFVGVDKSGNLVGEVDPAIAPTANDAVTTILASAMAEIDITALKEAGTISKQVRAAYITASGNYVLEMRAFGYGINAPYKPNGVEIVFQIAISADGKIVAVQTISHQESKGYGDKCATDAFYAGWIGKDASNYTDVVIAGATLTTKGYQEAVLIALNSVEILKGDSN
jgi:Na+-translocating ferredoxin:NAD+ oxidoreductase RnfG subunit